MGLFYYNDFSVCIVWGTKNFFFLFDPHSRDSDGLICQNGTAILLKFSSLLAIEKYLIDVYLKNKDNMLVDLQYVEVLSHDEVETRVLLKG